MKSIYFSAVLFCALIVVSAQTPPDFEKEPSVKWRFKTTAPIFSSPVINDGVAYFGGLDSTVYALDVQTGAVKWKVKTRGEIRSTVTISGNKLFLLGGNGVLSCFDKGTGKINWVKVFDNTAIFLAERRYDFADYYHSSPVVHNGVIYFGSGNSYINAVREEDGEFIWRYRTNDIVHTQPTISGDKLFAGSFDGYLYALNLRDGSPAWKFKAVGHKYFPNGEMQGFPSSGHGQIFVGSRDYNLYAIDEFTGQAHWSRRFPAGWALSTTVKDSVLYVGTSDDRVLVAIDARSGQELWKSDVKFNIFGTCTFSKSMVYVGTIWGKLYGIDCKTGKIKWAFATDGYKANHLNYFKADDSYRDDIGSILKAPIEMIAAEYKMGGIFSQPAIANDMIVVTTTEGIVYGLKK